MTCFRPGQLVCVNAQFIARDAVLELFNTPGGWDYAGRLANIIGHLACGDVALVVARLRAAGEAVYVIGPNGGGWAPGAFLRVLYDKTVVT